MTTPLPQNQARSAAAGPPPAVPTHSRPRRAVLDLLALEALALEEAFYHQGQLDKRRWLALVRLFEIDNRPYRAARTRQRLAVFLAHKAVDRTR